MHQKICCKCKKSLSTTSFSKHSLKKDGLNDVCKQCHAEYKKQHYKKNPKAYMASVIGRKRKMIQRVSEYKVTKGCCQCGNKHPAVLEFHHLDQTQKETEISNAIKMGWGWDRILQEISKCCVICANCHRILHYDSCGQNVK